MSSIVTSITELNVSNKPIHLAIGMFDGVHLGHRAVIESAVSLAQESGGLAVVLTFQPHPSRIFRPQQPTLLIIPSSVKSELILESGVNVVVIQEFTQAFALLEAEEFPVWLKQGILNLHSISIGDNFRYGARREGNVESLISDSKPHGINVYSTARIRQNGQRISSTLIREKLSEGDMVAVNSLLGYTYRSAGIIVRGQQLGVKLGYPTLNIKWEAELMPRFGVYAVKVRGFNTHTGWQNAIANFGQRPTVSQSADEVRLEVHLFGECNWNEGDNLEVEWHHFIRSEQKFSSLDELKQQIAVDCEAAKQFLDV